MRIILPLSLTALLVLPAIGARGADDFTRDIKYSQEREARQQQVYDDFTNDLAPFAGSFGERDLSLAKKDADNSAQLWHDAAAAFEKGDPEAGRKLQQDATVPERRLDIWRDRIRARVHQAQLAPTEEQYNQMAQNASPQLQPAVGAFFEAQKAASAAAGKLADGITPDADPKLIETLKDDCLAAEAKADIARSAMNAANDDQYHQQNPQASSPELTALEAKIAANRKEYADAYLQAKLLQRKVERLEQEYRALNEPRNRLVDQARQAAEKAKEQASPAAP